LRDLQRHPAKPFVLHVDLQRVRDDVEMTVVLPLRILNEETAVGVKMEGGILMRNASDIEISCLPKFLPEFIELDVAELGVGDALHLSDIKLPEGVISTQLSYGEDHDQAVVSIVSPKAEVIEDTAPEAPESEDGEDSDSDSDSDSSDDKADGSSE